MKKLPLLIGAEEPRHEFYRNFPLWEETLEVESLGCLRQRVQADQWDLLIIDCGSDARQGLSLLQQIKPEIPELPVIFVTESPSAEMVLAAFRLGARDYFHKPFDLREFNARIGNFLTLKRASGEVRQFQPPEAIWPGPAGRVEQNDHIPLRILRTVRFMEDHLHEELSLTTLAHEAGMSKHHYCRTFKTAMGMSPLRFFNYRRVQKAKLLLAGKDLNITAVARKTGFDSLNTMNRWFRIFEQTSPSFFRSTTRPPRRT